MSRRHQYDLAAYRWDGRTWAYVEGRADSEGVRIGINGPAVYALLGSWRMADAQLTLALPASDPSHPAFPAEIRGQYRFSALPALQHGFVQAQLVLKRDSSGGAGEAAGNPDLDRTVAQTVLFFQPDPGQSQGAIDFDYTFQVDPLGLQAPLGSAISMYAALTVADSAAPTRRLSTAVAFTVMMPIKVVGSDVVRPDVPATDSQQALQWYVRLNGQTLLRVPATDLTLSLADVLARGGWASTRSRWRR